MFSSNSSQVSSTAANYIEDCFSTWLYTGNGTSQTITNGIDLSTKGGLVWAKSRSSSLYYHSLVDTVRGATNTLSSNSTAAQNSWQTVTAFNSDGFSVGSDDYANKSAATYASWTFRKQPKFFDVVTWTGDGTSSRAISHNLGSIPGCIISKTTGTTGNWFTYHRGLNGGVNPELWYLLLNTTAAQTNPFNVWGGTPPTSTNFSVGSVGTNDSGVTYVAYVYAHNAGGFGLTGTDNVISCGSFTADASGNSPAITLGYEPQWMMFKPTSTTGNWTINDVMRGWSQTAIDFLYPNTSAAEAEITGSYISPSATGTNASVSGGFIANATYIYIAIRRGPMKVPTDATKVFAPVAWTGTGGNATVTTSFVTDSVISHARNVAGRWPVAYDRLRGTDKAIWTSQTDAEGTSAVASCNFQTNIGYNLGVDSDFRGINQGGGTIYGEWAFQRAPSFFDEVCYTGTGTNQFINHNLGVRPDLYFVKRRNSAANWVVTINASIPDTVGILNSSNAFGGSAYDNGYLVNGTVPASNFGAGFGSVNNDAANASGSTYVAYLFATCAGVQYINSYVGDGTTGRTINCGFTGGARFVCIKATSTTGSWWTFDSARGIVTNNDPALQLNSTAAEVTSADAIDTASSGFIVNQEATCSLNASGVTYLVWAIA